MTLEKIGIIGANDLGGDLALIFVSRGLKVLLVDETKEILESAVDRLKNKVRELVKQKKITANNEEALFSRIQLSMDLKALRRSDFILETTLDHLNKKKEIIGLLDEIIDPDVGVGLCLTQQTLSSMIVDTKFALRFIGLHFIDKKLDLRLVEIVNGFKTSKEVLYQTKALLDKVEYNKILTIDSPGFIFDRLIFSLINEAANLVLERVSEPKEINDAIKINVLDNIGVLKLADLIGMDEVLKALENLYQEFKLDKYIPSPLIKRFVMAGHLGIKTGRGFFEYHSTEN